MFNSMVLPKYRRVFANTAMALRSLFIDKNAHGL